ncbi:MAG: FAD:protein FMN transferase [Peptococcaceae bacterium]|nr:FAD:protein FMN transferase [Peptococcaceae bacterium]
MKKSLFPKFISILLLICASGWIGYAFYTRNVHYRETRFLFDTEVYIEAHGWEAKQAGLQVLDRMGDLDAKLNKFKAGSELDKINQAAGQQPVEVSDLTFEVIAQSLQIAETTGGAFDPTVGPLMALWGFGSQEKQTVPSNKEISEYLKLVGYQKVILDQANKTVYLTRKGMMLDLGAIAKGYAVDQAVQILKEHNISSALVSAGGNIYTIGRRTNGSPWQIGIRDPASKEKIVGYIQLENQAIDTSGDYERFFWANGKKYSHIIDPRTGYPAQGVSGCTVIMPQAAQADAFATAAFVLGVDKGLDLIEEDNSPGVMIDSQGQMVLSSKMKELLIK